MMNFLVNVIASVAVKGMYGSAAHQDLLSVVSTEVVEGLRVCSYGLRMPFLSGCDDGGHNGPTVPGEGDSEDGGQGDSQLCDEHSWLAALTGCGAGAVDCLAMAVGRVGSAIVLAGLCSWLMARNFSSGIRSAIYGCCVYRMCELMWSGHLDVMILMSQSISTSHKA